MRVRHAGANEASTSDGLDWQRRAMGLISAFALAKFLLIWMRLVDGGAGQYVSVWSPFAFLVQDLWAVLCFGLLDLGICRLALSWPGGGRWLSRGMWAAYAACVLYVAFNIPFARLFSTPMTYQMWAAAGGALADSFLKYVTPSNVLGAFVVLSAAWAVPRRLRVPLSRRVGAGLGLAALCLLLLGPPALRRLETLGLHRNALHTLVVTALAQWRRPPPAPPKLPPLPTQGNAIDLTHLAGAASGYNVIWINLESTGARYLRQYGAKRDPMPNLSALTRRALVFSHAYAVYPESIKGLHSMLCSHAPGARTNARLYRAERLPCPSIAEQFARAGYRTGMFHSGRFFYLGMDYIVNKRGFHELVDADQIKSPYNSSFGVDEAATIRRIKGFFDRLKPQQRFFLMYLPITGHHPYKSPGKGPRPFGHKTEKARYLSDLYFGDTALGTLIAEVRRRGLFAKTLWIVLGDHGEAFYQHKGNFAHTLFIYEENMHVPLFVVLPTLGRQLRVPQIASLLDVAPTLLHLVGLPIPARYQGRSLLKPTPGVARFYADQARWLVGLRHGPWKYIHAMDAGRSKLFHLPQDPGERNNLVTRHPAKARRYRAHLRAWASQQRTRVLNPPRPTSQPTKPRP